MKTVHFFLMILVLSTISCQGQEMELHYKAQTRGFLYEIELKNNLVQFTNNEGSQTLQLTKNQQDEILQLVSNKDFKSIKSNLEVELLATDRVVPSEFHLKNAKTEMTLKFDHNNLPKELQKLIRYIEVLFEPEK